MFPSNFRAIRGFCILIVILYFYPIECSPFTETRNGSRAEVPGSTSSSITTQLLIEPFGNEHQTNDSVRHERSGEQSTTIKLPITTQMTTKSTSEPFNIDLSPGNTEPNGLSFTTEAAFTTKEPKEQPMSVYGSPSKQSTAIYSPMTSTFEPLSSQSGYIYRVPSGQISPGGQLSPLPSYPVSTTQIPIENPPNTRDEFNMKPSESPREQSSVAYPVTRAPKASVASSNAAIIDGQVPRKQSNEGSANSSSVNATQGLTKPIVNKRHEDDLQRGKSSTEEPTITPQAPSVPNLTQDNRTNTALRWIIIDHDNDGTRSDQNSMKDLPTKLLDGLRGYQIHINPEVNRINDTAHQIRLDVSVIRRLDSTTFKLPSSGLPDLMFTGSLDNGSLENAIDAITKDINNITSREALITILNEATPGINFDEAKFSNPKSEVTPVPPTIVTSTIQPPVLTSESYFSPSSFYTTTMSSTDLNSTRREFLSKAMTESEATTSMAPGTTAEEVTGVDRSENEIDSSDLNNEKVNSSGLDSSLLLGSNEIRGVSVSPYRSSSNVTSSQALGTISTAVPPCRDQSKSNATEVKKEKGDEVTMDGPETPKLESKWMLNGVAYGEEFMKKYGLVKSNGEEGGAAGRNVPFVDKRSSPSELIDALKSLIPQMKDSSNDKSINNNSIVIRESNRPHPQLKPRPQPQPLLMPSTPFNSLPQPQMQRQTQPKPQAERQDPRQSHNQMKPQLQPKPLPQPQVLQIPKPQIPAQANFQPQAKPPIQPELNIPPAKLQTKPHIQLKPAPQIIPKREQNPSPRYEYVNRDSNTNSHLSQPSLPSLPNQPPNQPNQPYMIEEIEHARGPRYAQRSEYNIGPEVFIRIIRHYFANALSPGEIKYTYERIPPKIKPQPLTFPRSPQPAPVIASNQHRAAAAYPNMKSQ